jgi:hypothetical protein
VRRAYLSISLFYYSQNIRQVHNSSKNSILFLSIFLIRNQFRVYGEKVLIQFMLLLHSTTTNISRLFHTRQSKRDLSNTQKPIFLNLFFFLFALAPCREREDKNIHTHKMPFSFKMIEMFHAK